MSAVKDDLLKAADYIDEHGWCQGDSGDASGRVCLVGALEMTINDRRRLKSAADALRHSIGCSRLSRWNDAPERTQAEVVAALRAAAAEVSS